MDTPRDSTAQPVAHNMLIILNPEAYLNSDAV
jgi:hypothetical protein